MTTTWKKELAGFAGQPLGDDERQRRDAVISREVAAGTPKAEIVEASGLSLVTVNRIARTTFPADPDPVTPARAPKATRERTSEHVAPQERRVRTTGAPLLYGHVEDMAPLPERLDGYLPWVTKCLTHEGIGTYKTRHEARYTDGTDFCVGCAAAVA